MVTKEQATDPNNREFHYAPACSATRVERWRRNGKTQTWKSPKRANEFRLPVKFGLYAYSAITHLNADEFHLASDCPIDHNAVSVHFFGEAK